MKKKKFLKYGIKTDYGDWDKNFTINILEKYIKNTRKN